MATKNLSDYDTAKVPSGKDKRFAIVVAEWNEQITKKLAEGAFETLRKHGVNEKNICVEYVPGTFELVFGAQAMMSLNFDAVIVLGCVIQGETKHFDYVCSGVTQGISSLNESNDTPVIFGVLTTDTLQQAIDRAGGKLGNKGDECAVAALKMAEFSHRILGFL